MLLHLGRAARRQSACNTHSVVTAWALGGLMKQKGSVCLSCCFFLGSSAAKANQLFQECVPLHLTLLHRSFAGERLFFISYSRFLLLLFKLGGVFSLRRMLLLVFFFFKLVVYKMKIFDSCSSFTLSVAQFWTEDNSRCLPM